MISAEIIRELKKGHARKILRTGIEKGTSCLRKFAMDIYARFANNEENSFDTHLSGKVAGVLFGYSIHKHAQA